MKSVNQNLQKTERFSLAHWYSFDARDHSSLRPPERNTWAPSSKLQAVDLVSTWDSPSQLQFQNGPVSYRHHIIARSPSPRNPETTRESARESAPLLASGGIVLPTGAGDDTEGPSVLLALLAARPVYKLTAVLLPSTFEPPVLVPRSMLAVEVQTVA